MTKTKVETKARLAAPGDIIPLGSATAATTAEDGPSSSGQSRVVYIGYVVSLNRVPSCSSPNSVTASLSHLPHGFYEKQLLGEKVLPEPCS